MTTEEEKLSEYQENIMSIEIGEVLAKLKEANVFDIDKPHQIILIERSSSNIDFKRNEILQVKRFTSLIQKYLPVLRYLSTNPTFENTIVETKRHDRIMGSLNITKTIFMKQREIQTGNSIICSEIKRNYETPENILVAIILVSILSYCDKFIKIYELTESLKGFDHTIYELKIIRKNVYLMLSKQLFRKILPVAIGLRNSLNTLIELISKRVKQQKISFHFINIFKLVYEWNYFISISFNNEEIARHVLQYYFMKITNINDLFECWIYFKLLFEISKKFDVKLKEVNSNRGACTFVSNDRSLNLIYQAKYDSRWKKQNNDEIYDYPDIVLEFTNGQRVIIDAKNSKYQYNNPTPNFGQMRSYLRSAEAQYGFFIHSNSENPNLWYKITDEKNTKQIVWTTLRPGENDINLKKILSIPSI